MNTKMRYFFPIGLLFFLLLDGSISLEFSALMYAAGIAISSLLVCLWLVMAVCYAQIDHIYFWAIIAGLIWDCFYSSIIGPMTLILPLMVYITKVAYEFFAPSFIVVLLIYLIDIAIVTGMYFMISRMDGLTNAAISTFIARSLGPSIAYNLATFVVLYFPLAKFFSKYSE